MAIAALHAVVVAIVPHVVPIDVEVDESAVYAANESGTRIVMFVQRSEVVGFSGSVLAARDGQVIAAASAGFADIERTNPNTPATFFELASVTKQFTAAAVLQLEQQNKLTLDDPISKHLPGVPANCSAITVRHLLQHTTGIPGSNSQGAGFDLEKVLPAFLRGGPQHPPGTHWEYWNQGYSLAAEIIARASGQSYMKFAREQVFLPAGLRLTRFTGDTPLDDESVAMGRSAFGAPRSAFAHPYGAYGFQYRGMGGAVSSVWELWRWHQALNGDKVLSGESRDKFFAPGLNDYALGWFVRTGPSGRVVQSHGGGVRGFACEVRRYPAHNACVFVLGNRDAAPVRQLADVVERMLFDEPVGVEPLPRPMDAELLKAATGRYKDSRGAEVVIADDDGFAQVQVHWAPSTRGPVTRACLGMDADERTILYEWSSATPMAVNRTASGAVESVQVSERTFRRVR